MSETVKKKSAEHGGAGFKFLIVLVVLFLIGNAGFNFIPVAYNGENFKQDMHTAVVQGVAVPGTKMTPVEAVKQKLQTAVRNNQLPEDVFVEVKMVNSIVSAHVVYSQEISILPFGIYKYQYQFDHTATPTGFLSKQ